MKRGKIIKRIIPFLCATLLLLGSSMTVFASDYDYSDIVLDGYDNYTYRFYVMCTSSQVGVVLSNEPILLSYGSYVSAYNSYFVSNTAAISAGEPVSDGAFVVYTDDRGETIEGPYSLGSVCFSQSVMDTIYTNHDLCGSDGTVFFQAPPQPIAEMAIPLTATVQTQTQIILPIAVGCLALLVGLTVLVRKLPIFLVR